ncbi:RNA polymerase sigma factor [Paenibacillus silvae]|uniref:RNA polymerase sigma factor n=1 Tax=Paenibacillus silvae TaxID=1325358 RepID=UPI0011A325FE|nr:MULTISPECIES: sigma-70 family RNA polymerase sigma factor [Paenibacillus]MCK6076013.1 sigma-70 family RNA polymerase sigma factor [Paenibacillus silvae]MCK6150402.1 sigma-70 family RNA polymerase sigma factor [Paenibacillus silvae]MCK6268700.1 sigma-70 family RNA polymerase sigma factor [Paenibacillus silvae]
MQKAKNDRQQAEPSAEGHNHAPHAPGNYSGMPDEQIVQHIKYGDQQAFDELVLRYRSRLHRYVRSITQDENLAEDVVQEGFIRAYHHMDQLQDSNRLLAWLQRIVRNQAYSYIERRIRLQEQCFSSFPDRRDSSSTDESGIRQHSPGHLLNDQLSLTLLKAQEISDDPYHAAAAAETNQYIRQLLAGLNEKERLICVSHWIEQLSPKDIADQTGLTIANIYQILSRCRKKLSRHHIQQGVDEMLRDNVSLLPQCVVLNEPQTFHAPLTWSSAAAAIYEMLTYIDNSLSLPMVMGCTGLAFRITIFPANLHIAGPTAFNFKEVLGRGLRHMGYLPSSVEATASEVGLNANLVEPALLQDAAKNKRMLHPRLIRALSMIRYSVSRGIPAVVWDLNIPEFGLVYGYDDQSRTLHGVDFIQSAVIPYDHLGRGVNEEIFVLSVEPGRIRDEINLKAVLQDALAHYEGRDANTLPGTVSGLAAYGVWREALRTGDIEPNGHAYNIAVLWDARAYARSFFAELRQLWTVSADKNSIEPTRDVGDNLSSICLNTMHFIQLCQMAEEKYCLIAEKLHLLVECFPFPDGGALGKQDVMDQAIAVLQEVEQLERAVMAILHSMYVLLEDV